MSWEVGFRMGILKKTWVQRRPGLSAKNLYYYWLDLTLNHYSLLSVKSINRKK